MASRTATNNRGLLITLLVLLALPLLVITAMNTQSLRQRAQTAGSVQVVDASGNPLTTTDTSSAHLKITLPSDWVANPAAKNGLIEEAYAQEKNVDQKIRKPTRPPKPTRQPKPTSPVTPTPVVHVLQSMTIENKDTDGSSGGSSPLTVTSNFGAYLNTPFPWELNSLLSEQTSASRNVQVTLLDTASNTALLTSTITLSHPAPTPTPTPVTPSPTPVQSYQRLFITSTSYNGNLDGLSGADAKCQERANAAGLGGTWKAWLSDNTTSATSRLIHHSTPYKTINNIVVANNWADLTTNSFFVGVDYDEFGSAKTGFAWTNTKASGEIATVDTSFSLGAHCRNWVTSLSTINHLGAVGNTNLTGSGWTWDGSKMCGEQHSLYCFEQTSMSSVQADIN